MVAVGELSIIGTMDVKEIDRGFSTIQRHQDVVENKNQRMIGDFTRLGGVVSTVATGFAAIGTSTIALVNFAKNAPALAGSMASLSVSMGRIQRSLGEGLQGPVGAFSNVMESLSEFAESNPNAFTALAIGAGALTTLFGLNLVTKGAALASVLSGMKALTFSTGAIAGLSVLAGILTIKNWDDIKSGVGAIKDFATSGESREQFKQSFSQMSEGGFGGDLLEGAKMFFSPLAEIFGASPYTPEGWREQGEFVRSGLGTDFIRTQQNISYSSRNIVLGQGDLTP